MAAGFFSIITMVKKTNNVKEPATQCPEPTQIESVLCVVIPYSKKWYHADALEMAILSWLKFFVPGCKIVVIGDEEDWFGEEVLHIPMTVGDVSLDEFHWHVACRTLLLEEVSERFIFAEPDTFVVNPITDAYVNIPKFWGYDDDGNPDFSVGLPFPISKTCLCSLSEKFLDGFPTQPLSSCCIIAQGSTIPIELNWTTDNWHLPVITSKPDFGRFRKLVSIKCFVKAIGIGWSPFLLKWLRDHLK